MSNSMTPNIERTQKKMLKTPLQNWKNVVEENNVKYDEENISHGKFGEVIIGKVSPFHLKFSSPNIALKTQYITKPKDLSDTSYRELLILQELKKLKENHSCPGFITIYDWFKTKGNLDEYEEDNSYMNLVLEKADITLKKFLLNQNYQIPLNLYKNILFQMLYALSLSQEICEFIHHDLHFDNIMLKFYKNETKTEFNFKNQKYHLETDFLIKITDFGLSRIKNVENDKIIFNPKLGKFFDPSIDVNQIGRELKKIKIIFQENEMEEKLKLSALKRKMNRNIVNATELLSHSFFDSLKSQFDFNDEIPFKFGMEIEKEEKLNVILFENKENVFRNQTIVKTRRGKQK